VQQLRQADQQFAQTMAVNTMIGAAGEAALGGLIGGNWQSALYGALAGGATAAAGTYAQARFQQEADDERPAYLIANNMNHDTAEMQRAVIARLQLARCRSLLDSPLERDGFELPVLQGRSDKQRRQSSAQFLYGD
jgi:hypothetical protein